MGITFDWINFCLLCNTPKRSEQGNLPVPSHQYCPEMFCFRNIRISKMRRHLYTGGTYKLGFMVVASKVIRKMAEKVWNIVQRYEGDRQLEMQQFRSI